jgi:hypothetical protein
MNGIESILSRLRGVTNNEVNLSKQRNNLAIQITTDIFGTIDNQHMLVVI